MIGSPTKAATVSGPSSRILSSIALAAWSPKASGDRSPPWSYQWGSTTCTKPGSGRSAWPCMALMPPRLAAAMVLPW